MARFRRIQIRKQPPSSRGQINNYHPLVVVPTQRNNTSAKVSESAQQTVNDIDDVLAQNEAAKTTPTPSQINKDEATPKAPTTTKADEDEAGQAGLNDQIGDGYKHDPPNKRRKLLTRRRLVGGGAAGLLIGGSFGLLLILQGPLQLKHLSEILKKNGWASERMASLRLKVNYRYIKTSSVGETRVGAIGSRLHQNSIRKLGAIGITFPESDRTGQITRVSVDAAKHPEFKASSAAQNKRAIAGMLGVSESQIRQINGLGAGQFVVITRSMGITEVRSIVDHTLRNLNDGKIVTGMRFRNMAKWSNLPSLFHPFKRAEAKIERKVDNRLHLRELEKKRKASRKGLISQKALAAKNRINSALDGKRRAISAALVATDVVCLVRNVADAIPAVNYGYVVAPSMIEATDIISSGDQLGSGQDFDLEQINARTASFTDDEGHSIWESKPLNALASSGAGHGKDLEPNLKQAFTPLSRGDIIRNAIGVPSGLVDNVVSDVACSNLGIAFQGMAGLALTFFSGGTWTAGKVATAAAQSAVTVAVIGFLMERAIDHFTEDPVKAFSGPVGGSLMAFGSRAAYNSVDRSTGAVELDASEETALLKEQQQQELQEFQSQGFFARVFNLNDHRSLASTAVRTTDLDATSIIANITAGFMNTGKFATNLFSAFTPKLQAEEELYNWGFPKYAIPKRIINDPKYENPFENADILAGLFNKNPDSPYIKRARNCFGVEITKGAEGWDAISQEDVNPAEQEYINANCSDLRDENWIRTMLFVYDTGLLTSVDCYDGEETSCQRLGFGGAAPTSPEQAGSTIVGDPYTDSSSVACAPGTTDLKLHDGYVEGKKFTVHLCALSNLPSSGQADNPGSDFSTPGANGFAIVNSRVSGAWFALVDAAKKAGINLSAKSSFRSMAHQQALWEQNPDPRKVARPGYSSHQAGVALDFEGMGISGGDTCSTRARMPSNPAWVWLRDNAEKYGFKQFSVEAWHWDALPASNRCGAAQP